MSKQSLIIEVCVDSVESALAAQKGGADRVELCDNLLEGGTTPSAGTIELARQYLQIGLQVIIRPRGGDFCYSDIEFDIMKRDIAVAKELGANGVVIGILTPDGDIDLQRTRVLVEAARPMNVTFHRAFDMARDPYQALEGLIGLDVDRVLTSGQEISVLEGIDVIQELVRKADGQIIIMPGGGTERNVQKIVNQCGVKEIHVAVTHSVESMMRYRNPRVFMGGELRPPEYSRSLTDAARLQQLRQAIH